MLLAPTAPRGVCSPTQPHFSSGVSIRNLVPAQQVNWHLCLLSDAAPLAGSAPGALLRLVSRCAGAIAYAGEESSGTQLLRYQYLYFCPSKASKLAPDTPSMYAAADLRVSICTFVLVKQANWSTGTWRSVAVCSSRPARLCARPVLFRSSSSCS